MLTALLAQPHQLYSTANQAHIRRFAVPIDYTASLQAMQQFTAQRPNAAMPDEVWLLEHPHTFTLGASQNHSNVAAHLHPVHSDRGGKITWHGAGQLVVYCMLDLGKRQWHSRDLVSASEALIIASLAKHNVRCQAHAKAPGVYCLHGAKIASLGFKLKQQFSYHGMAVNVSCNLQAFSQIDPCGYPGQAMTSLAAEQPNTIDLQTTYTETLLALLPSYLKL
jgi:lipoyl(octanoyl) transferase